MKTELIRYKKHIWLLVFTIAFVLCFFEGKAQEDSVFVQSFARFEKNAVGLQELYFANDPEFYPGKFYFFTPENIREVYLQNNNGLFPGFSQEAFQWYQRLDSLPKTDKKNLVRFFSFYENRIEKALNKAGLPVSLKYLAPALSAMNPAASGTERRAGVWQLTHFQAILNGGKISRLVDERLNVGLETLMAVRQLQQNFGMYTEPELAVAAFLCGHTQVNNTMYRAGKNAGVETVIGLLPAGVHQTIAAFQALTVFLQANRFEPSVEPFQPKIKPDTALVTRRLHFQQVEDVIGIPVKQLHDLNPQYTFMIVPGESKPMSMALPHGKKDDFLVWSDSIYHAGDSSLFRLVTQHIEYPPESNRQYVGESVKDLTIDGKIKIEYRIKTGDVLGIIAEKYDVKISDLKYWNNIYNERRIQAGQKINIFVPDDKVDYYASLDEKSKDNVISPKDVVKQIQQSSTLPVLAPAKPLNKVEHVVKNGESPYVIAKQYKGVTPELILEWNHIKDPRKIQIGQKLILYPKR